MSMFKKDKIAELGRLLDRHDTVLVGAGAGLSTSAGFTYAGERFEKHFADFIDKYGFSDMYSAGFHRFSSLEEHWAFWSRFIFVNRYCDPPKATYSNLLRLVGDKECFVLTTNVDHCFQKAGFDRERLFYTQGDYGLWQCSVPCHGKTYDNEDMVRRMVAEQKDMRVPAELVPHCPVCGEPMAMNLRADATFVEDEGWEAACTRYQEFIGRHEQGPILYLELGVGMNTPAIIKYPFWKWTWANPKARLVTINLGECEVPAELEGKSLCVNADIDETLEAVLALNN